MLLLLWAGCGLFDRGDAPAIPPEQKYLEAPDQTLPPARLGEPYSAQLQVSGGDFPYTWEVADGDKRDVPQGLEVSADGVVGGTPTEAGDFVFAAVAHDSVGREKRTQIAVEVVLEPQILQCGDVVSGVFTGTASSSGGPDLSDLEDIEWLAVELPGDLTTRIELDFSANSAVTTLYVTNPGAVAGSWNTEDDYVATYLNPAYSPMVVPIDAGTNPSLTGYLTEPYVPMVLVPDTQGAWELEVVCTDGPVFVRLPQYPTELLTQMAYNFEVYGDQEGVTIRPVNPSELPSFILDGWNETTGEVTGTALQPGTWEFAIVAETEDGRRREEETIIGVFPVTDVACGDTVDVEVDEGYFDGDFIAFYDPKGFQVYRLPIAEGTDVSSVELVASQGGGQYLGLASTNPGSLKFYGGAERLYDPSSETSIAIDPRTYPAPKHYEAFGEMFLSAGALYADGPTEVLLEVVCDHGPRVEEAGLPVYAPLVAGSSLLDARGGVAPYTFGATGLPSGVTLSAEGLLSGTTGAVGTYDVTVTVTDKVGAYHHDDYVFYVGHDEACDGYTRVSCDDSIEGEFTNTYFSDGSGTGSTEVFCIVDDGTWLAWEVYADDAELRADVVDPGRSADDLFDLEQGTFITWVTQQTSAGIGVDSLSWPDLDDYDQLPVLFTLRAYNPGSWTAHLTCPAGGD
jgi:hypothetical protein